MKYSKMHFVKVDQESLSSLQQILDSTGNALTKSFKMIFEKLKSSRLRNDEIIQGFDDDWMEGIREFVLHPYGQAE
ncbi:hypothetical protein P7H20_23020 [Paenibacillus larvae]|nr:hypothetical protein [Paenibacillus larvae]MDT2277136.1 hypothetical protein [Paenibacillus larvae]